MSEHQRASRIHDTINDNRDFFRGDSLARREIQRKTKKSLRGEEVNKTKYKKRYETGAHAAPSLDEKVKKKKVSNRFIKNLQAESVHTSRVVRARLRLYILNNSL